MSAPFKGHFDQIGEGPPILCIPGFGSSNRIFRPLAERLKDRFCLILPDNRGMGQSPAAWKPYQLDDLAGDCLNLMDSLHHERFAVIGLSMGGFVAQLLTLQAPQRVGALALLCSTSGGEAFQQVFPSLSEEQVKGIYSLKAQARIEAALSPAICPLLKTRYPDVYQQVLGWRSREQENLPQIMLQYYAVSQFMANTVALESITCPTLVMNGDTDLLVPLINAEMLVERIPGAQLSVITETDHLFFLEKEQEVAEKLGLFLGG
ncbi:MAG: alpha/beta hydrolase [Magnetococcales bacterium]|nr:alpha/beta hydrolase [Magnetococcales bacterium]